MLDLDQVGVRKNITYDFSMLNVRSTSTPRRMASAFHASAAQFLRALVANGVYIGSRLLTDVDRIDHLV